MLSGLGVRAELHDLGPRGSRLREEGADIWGAQTAPPGPRASGGPPTGPVNYGSCGSIASTAGLSIVRFNHEAIRVRPATCSG